MKLRQQVLPSAFVSLLLLSSGLAVGVNKAEANPVGPDQFRTWAEQQGYRCQNQEGAFLCKRIDPLKNTAPVQVDKDLKTNTVGLQRSRRGVLTAGTSIPTQSSNSDRAILSSDETLDLTLSVTSDITDGQSNTVLIPRDSTIEGKLLPFNGGIRFEAERLVLADGRSFAIDAHSDVIPPKGEAALYPADTEFDVANEGNSLLGGSILDNSLITEAAGVLISTVMNGDLDLTSLFKGGLNSDFLSGDMLGQLGSILGGVLGGNLGSSGGDLLGGGGTESLPESEVNGLQDLVVVYPDQDLDLTLASDLQIR